MRPRVSVCVPAYQSAPHLQELLDSVWRQDFEEFELVVVDDGSTDETPAILAAQSDPRLRFFRRERNLGQVATVAESVARARGELVKFLDADDLLHPECVGAMVATLDAYPQAVCVFSRRTIVVEDQDDPASRAWMEGMGELHHGFARIEEINDGRELLREYLQAGLPGNWIAEPAGVMARRADVVAVGGYNRRLRQNNDVDVWVRLMARGDVAFIDRPLYEYRLAFSGVTGRSSARERQWLDPLWTTEGLAQMPGFPEPAELAATRRRLLAKALRRVAVSPLREPRETLARVTDLGSYGAYRLARAIGRGRPLHSPIDGVCGSAELARGGQVARVNTDRPGTASAEAAAPLFLVASERSGTTLLRLMLDHHPEIAFEKEFDFVVMKVSDAGEFPSLHDYVEWLAAVHGPRYAIDRSLDYRELVNDFLQQKQATSGGKPHVGATIHRNFDRLRFLWPDARYIHLLRDPRDVARSVLQKGWAGNIYQAAEYWIEAERCWDCLAPHLSNHQSIEIHYEDLVTRAEDVLTDICHFVGVEYSERMLDYPADAPQYPPPDPSLVTQWKAKLSPRKVALVEARTGALMERRGYRPSTRPVPKVGPPRHQLLLRDAQVRRLRTRVGLLGPRLVAMDVVGRRLRLRRLAMHAQRHINAIGQRQVDAEVAGERAPSANIAPVGSQPRLGRRASRI